MTTAETYEFSFPVDITQLSSSGRVYDLSADAEERGLVAERLNLSELIQLDAKVTIASAAGGLITVNGALRAEIVQACVVSLEPVKATIAEDFELTFARAAKGKKVDKDDDELEVLPDENTPDELMGDEIDLGEVVVEQLALLIDPYPRAPGAVFKNLAPDTVEVEKPAISPFAVLAKLKTNNKNN